MQSVEQIDWRMILHTDYTRTVYEFMSLLLVFASMPFFGGLLCIIRV